MFGTYTYDEAAAQRDLRIDFIRGLAMLFVVVDHVNLLSGYYIITHEGLGVFTGAGIFVMVSGFILGIINRRRLQHSHDLAEVRKKLWGRAFTIYKLALTVALLLFFLRFTGWLDVTPLTTYPDPSSGIREDLFQAAGIPASALVFHFLSLHYSPAELNVLGLYVALLLFAPAAFWLLKKRRAWIVLAFSWGLYLFNEYYRVHLTPAAFERPFPLMSWQVFFFTGLVAGWYKEKIFGFFYGRHGKKALVAVGVITCCLMFYSWNNPWEPVPYHARLKVISEWRFTHIYALFFQRVFPGVGRILNVMFFLVFLFTILTVWWQPLKRFFGWFFIPVGQASLYVFTVHIVFVLAVYHIPYLQTSTVKFNTLVHTFILLLVWLMVRYRVLFRIIPR